MTAVTTMIRAIRTRMPAIWTVPWPMTLLIVLNGCVGSHNVRTRSLELSDFGNPAGLRAQRSPSSSDLDLSSTSLPPLDPAQQHRLLETERYCAWCHSSTGARPISPAPKLAGQQAQYLVDQINDFKSHKRNNPLSKEIMWPAVRAIQDDLIPYLADYFSHQTIWSTNDADATLAAEGKRIYTNGVPSHNVMACIYCHGPEAKGNGVVPRLASQSRYYIRRQLLQWRQGYRSYAVPMPDEAKGLDESEINAISEYVSSLQ